MPRPSGAERLGLTRDILRLLGQVFTSVPAPTVVLVVATLLSSARAGMYVASMGGATQALIERDQDGAVGWALVFAGAAYGEYLFYPFRSHLESIILNRTIHHLQRRVLDRASSVPLVVFEHGTFFARLERASDDLGSHVSAILNSLLSTAQLVVMGVSVLAPL